jgi:hypothetical protein
MFVALIRKFLPKSPFPRILGLTDKSPFRTIPIMREAGEAKGGYLRGRSARTCFAMGRYPCTHSHARTHHEVCVHNRVEQELQRSRSDGEFLSVAHGCTWPCAIRTPRVDQAVTAHATTVHLPQSPAIPLSPSPACLIRRGPNSLSTMRKTRACRLRKMLQHDSV